MLQRGTHSLCFYCDRLPAVHAECVGTDSELAGKAAGCEGCPNQEACATAPKGPDPGAARFRRLSRCFGYACASPGNSMSSCMTNAGAS